MSHSSHSAFPNQYSVLQACQCIKTHSMVSKQQASLIRETWVQIFTHPQEVEEASWELLVPHATQPTSRVITKMETSANPIYTD